MQHPLSPRTRLRSRAAAVLGSESGNLMVTTMIGSLVLLIVVGALAAGIGAFALLQQAVSTRAGVTNESVLTDTAFRDDVQWASSIAPTDAHTVQMTVIGEDGHCHVSTWTISAGTAATTVQQQIVNYPSFDATVNPVACSGTPSDPVTQTMVSDADPNSAFSYANAGGRELDYTSGTGTLGGSTTPPDGITATAWGSSKLASVALVTALSYSTDHRASYRFAQAAGNLSTAQGTTDAASHFVPEGDLTALP